MWNALKKLGSTFAKNIQNDDKRRAALKPMMSPEMSGMVDMFTGGPESGDKESTAMTVIPPPTMPVATAPSFNPGIPSWRSENPTSDMSTTAAAPETTPPRVNTTGMADQKKKKSGMWSRLGGMMK